MPGPDINGDQGSGTMLDATFSRRDMLRAGGALAAAAAFAEPFKVAAAEPGGADPTPTFWADSAMPEVTHRMIETNGIHLHAAEQGEGPLIILCHGFPECWYSWRHQLPALAKAGFRVVAPDLRGYGRSDRPEEVEKYTILHDIDDIVGLVDALGAEQAVIADHDIGATVAWQAALLRPDRFRGVIALSPPFRPRAFGGSVPTNAVGTSSPEAARKRGASGDYRRPTRCRPGAGQRASSSAGGAFCSGAGRCLGFSAPFTSPAAVGPAVSRQAISLRQSRRRRAG